MFTEAVIAHRSTYMTSFRRYFSGAFLLALFVLIPLYFENAYFNILDAKYHAFCVVYAVAAVPMIVLLAHRAVKREFLPLDLTDVGVICFAAVALVSSAFSGRFTESFFGTDGWFVGSLAILAAALTYFFVSRCYTYRQNLLIPVYAVNVIIFLFGILHFAGADVFGMHDGILQKQYYQYLSTLGNTNWCAGYLCLFVPAAFVFFLSAKSKATYRINLIFLTFALAMVLLIISDGVYLGLGFCLFFAIPFAFKSILRVRRTALLGLIFGVEALTIRLAPCFSGLMAKANGVSGVVFDLRVCVAIVVVCGAAFGLTFIPGVDNAKALKIACIVCEVALAAAAAAAAVYTAIGFNDKWGSSRGMIWRVSFEKTAGFTPLQKVFGIGPELLREQYLEVQATFKNLPVVSSHSEPIQILMTTGTAGVLSWLAIIVGTVRGFVKGVAGGSDDQRVLTFAYFLPLTAYFAQSFVNSATLLNLLLLAVFAAFFRSLSAQSAAGDA